MRFIITIIWSLFLSGMISFILSSIGEQPFNFSLMLIIAALFCIVTFFLAEVALKSPEAKS